MIAVSSLDLGSHVQAVILPFFARHHLTPEKLRWAASFIKIGILESLSNMQSALRDQIKLSNRDEAMR